MLPATNMPIDFEIERQSSKTYKLNIEDKNIRGTTDDLEAMRQAVYLIVNTERYEHIIYSWAYGIETKDLFGKPINYVTPVIKQRIIEAVKQDDRVLSVDNFEFENSKGKVLVKFTVHTIFGDVAAEKGVSI